MVKNLLAMQETWVWFLGPSDPLEKRMATHSSIVAWRFPWAEVPSGLQSMGWERAGHGWVTNTYMYSTFTLQSIDFNLTWRCQLGHFPCNSLWQVCCDSGCALCLHVGQTACWTCLLGCSYSCLTVMPRVWGTWDTGWWGPVGNMSFFLLGIFIVVCLNQCIYDVPWCSFHISCVWVNWFFVSVVLKVPSHLEILHWVILQEFSLSLISCFLGTLVIHFSILKVVSKLPVAQFFFACILKLCGSFCVVSVAVSSSLLTISSVLSNLL